MAKSDPIDRLFVNDVHFIAGAGTPESLPPQTLPEIAVWGRSNVGKSSLLNALTGRKSLARISKTPGRTQQINFFEVADRLILADLPGYGYAKVARHKISAWEDLINAFLSTRRALRQILLLIDARHGLKEVDIAVIEDLESRGLNYSIVLTKVDKSSNENMKVIIQNIKEDLSQCLLADKSVYLTSADDNIGISELRKAIAGFVDTAR
jgi:GTP-binding protein